MCTKIQRALYIPFAGAGPMALRTFRGDTLRNSQLARRWEFGGMTLQRILNGKTQ